MMYMILLALHIFAGKAHLIAARQRREAAQAELGTEADDGRRPGSRSDHSGSRQPGRGTSAGGDNASAGPPAAYLQDVKSGRAQMQRPSSDFSFGR